MTGTDQKSLDIAIQEHFAPGQTVDLFLELPGDLNDDEVSTVRKDLESQGLKVQRAEMGAHGDWPNALRLQFRRPSRPKGIAVLPLAVMIIGALGLVGVASFMGWKLGDAVSRNIVPILALGAGAFIGYKFLQQRGAVR